MQTAIKQLLSIIQETGTVPRQSGEPLSRETIDQVLHAAMFTHSGTQLLPWKFILLNDRELLDTLVECVFVPGINITPAAGIVVCVFPEEIAMSNQSIAIQESVDTADNMVFIARLMGLQAETAALYPDDVLMSMVRGQVNIPVNVIPAKLVCIG